MQNNRMEGTILECIHFDASSITLCVEDSSKPRAWMFSLCYIELREHHNQCFLYIPILFILSDLISFMLDNLEANFVNTHN